MDGKSMTVSGGGFDLQDLWSIELEWENDEGIDRFKDLVVNFTNSWGECTQLLYNNGEYNPYFKLESPREPESTVVYQPIYKYDFQFEESEIYATTWIRKKISFLNFLAKEWGGKIKTLSEG